MWTPTTRRQHSRPVTRYQTDLTDAEWRVIVPHLPKPCATGRPRAWPMREILNGIFYLATHGLVMATAQGNALSIDKLPQPLPRRSDTRR